MVVPSSILAPCVCTSSQQWARSLRLLGRFFFSFNYATHINHVCTGRWKTVAESNLKVFALPCNDMAATGNAFVVLSTMNPSRAGLSTLKQVSSWHSAIVTHQPAGFAVSTLSVFSNPPLYPNSSQWTSPINLLLLLSLSTPVFHRLVSSFYPWFAHWLFLTPGSVRLPSIGNVFSAFIFSAPIQEDAPLLRGLLRWAWDGPAGWWSGDIRWASLCC